MRVNATDIAHNFSTALTITPTDWLIFLLLSTSFSLSLYFWWAQYSALDDARRSAALLSNQQTIIDLLNHEKPDVEQVLAHIAECDISQLKIDRISLWRFNEQQTNISCLGYYQSGEVHSLAIKTRLSPVLLSRLKDLGHLAAKDINSINCLGSFAADYLDSFNIASVLITPVYQRDRTIGMLCQETIGTQRTWHQSDKAIAKSIANLSALAVTAMERHQTERSLRNREELLRNTQRLAGIGSFISVHRGDLVSCSDQFYSLFDLDRISFKPTKSNLIARVHLDDKARLLTKLSRQSKTRDALIIEFRAQHNNGKWLHFELISNCIKNGQDQVSGLGGSIRDITEKVKNRAEKSRLKEQLYQSQRLETVGTLAGGIAHDFNNILSPIMGFAELSLLSVPKSDTIADNMRQIIKGANRAKDLIQQIMLFSQSAEVKYAALDLNTIIHETIALMRASIPANIKLVYELDEHCGLVSADSSQIHQVLLNLCANAWQAMEELGAQGTLSIKLNQVVSAIGQPQALLSVSDTGPGMSTAVMARIFEPFYTTKPVNKGTGLGLAMVHGIIDGHGGSIDVSSKLRVGSHFEIRLPIIQANLSSREAC